MKRKNKPNKAKKITPKITEPRAPVIFGDFWDLEHWPPTIWPHETEAARHRIRCDQDKLVADGVIVRVGRSYVINGDRWRAWIMRPEHLQAVTDFENNLTKQRGGSTKGSQHEDQ